MSLTSFLYSMLILNKETQITGTCDFDYILIPDAHSKPGAVSMVPENIESYSGEFVILMQSIYEIESWPKIKDHRGDINHATL